MSFKEDMAYLQVLMNSDSILRSSHLCIIFSIYMITSISMLNLISHKSYRDAFVSGEAQPFPPILSPSSSSNLLLSQTLLHHEAHHSLLVPSVLLLPVTALIDKTLHAPLQREV